MYSLLVIDDEIFAVKGITQGIDWSDTAISNVFEAYSVNEAKEIFNGHKINIALCDIEMPQNNGVELAEWIKINHPNTEIIFLTGHANFDYAHKALKLNCFDYILKPVKHEDLKSAVLSAVNKVKTEEEKQQFTDIYKKYYNAWDSQLPILVERFWQELLLQRFVYSKERLNSMLSLYNIALTLEDKILPILINVEEWKEPLSFADEEIMEYGLRNIASEIVLQGVKGVVIRDYDGDNCILIYKTKGSNEVSLNIAEICKGFIDVCNQSLHCELSCYIGQEVEFDQLTTEFEKLLKVEENNITNPNTIIDVRDIKETVFKTIQYPHFNEWSMLLETGKVDEVINEVEDYFLNITNLTLTSEMLHNYYFGFMHMVYSIFHKHELSIAKVYSNNELLENKYNFNSIEKLKAWSIQILDIGFKQNKDHSTTNSALVDKMIKYIKENLNRRFSREDISQIVYLNPAYMSRLFKKQVGMSISGYIINSRVNKAKELLENSNEKVSDISISVGYDNFSHFTKMFKKVTRLSPQEYRKKYQI